MESKNVGVLGGGAWGTGLAQALARGGHTVQMWALEPEVKESVNKEHENKRYLPGYKLSENLTVSNDIIEVATGASKGTPVAASPFGSAGLLPITYGYLKMCGRDGLAQATKYAILNANYMRTRIATAYNILYTGTHGMCAHEFIMDCNQFSLSSGVQCGDIAKYFFACSTSAPSSLDR